MTGAFLNKRFYRRNLIFWGSGYGLLMLAQMLVHDHSNRNYDPYRQTTGTVLVAMAIFYINFFLCNTLFVQRKMLYWLSLAGLTALFITLTRWVLYLNNAEFHYSKTTLTAVLLSATMYYIILILVSAFYWSTLFAAQKIRENAAIQLDLQRMATEKVTAEKKFLQSQVNPHFLHNTLNFLYAKSLKAEPELSDGIMTLSNIMKYALQKNENSSGMVLLKDEIEHLENVIHIHQLRFAGRLKIQLVRPPDVGGVEIVPFILITLVENALKHGDQESEHCPIRIHLHCEEQEQKLYFSVSNAKRDGPKELSTGIGLDNAVRRLKDTYGHAASLAITDHPGHYKAELVLPLLKTPHTI